MVRKSVSPSERKSLEKTYGEWKQKALHEAGWFPIFNGFKREHLRKLSGNAVKLYIYFGIHGRSDSGRSWHSIETMAEFFGKSPRAINDWIKELVEAGLIARYQTQTFLLPYEASFRLATEAVAADSESSDQQAVSPRPKGRIARMVQSGQRKDQERAKDVDIDDLPF